MDTTKPYNLTREQFAAWCVPVGNTKHTEKVHLFFTSIKWTEGFVYCSESWNYAKTTGYDCIHHK